MSGVQTHCKRDHEFTPENTRLDNRGSRHCRACDRERPKTRAPYRRGCSVEGCDGIYQGRGLCWVHYSRMKRTGTTDPKPRIEDEFWSYVLRGGPDECWVWTGSIGSAGYGRIGKRYVHRISCEWAHGAPPAIDSVVRHSCDNPPCVNPAHVSWGTQSENVKDTYDRGRR